MPELPQSVWQGTFMIFGVTLHCHVLDNGQRVIEADDLVAMFEGMNQNADLGDLEAFGRWQRGLTEGERGRDG